MKKQTEKPGFAIGALRTLTVAGITVLLLAVLAYFVLLLVFRGPSPTAKELLTRSLKETSAAYMIPDWFLSEAEVNAIMAPQDQRDLSQDTSLISIPTEDPFSYATEAPVSGPTLPPDATPAPAKEPEDDSHFVEPGIEIYDIASSTYRGKLMIIHDPSRVRIGVLDAYGEENEGLFLSGFIEKYNAVAVANAGGFYDPNGKGNGGIPSGLVIGDGRIVWGEPDRTYSICGFDDRGILYVGDMTGNQAIRAGVTSACSFGPALIVNGTPVKASYSGLNPRTAVGQRADGAILLLTLAGRQVDCIGASYTDITEILYSFGAVNATNLDGGSSSMLYYRGERQIKSSSLIGERRLPNAVVVLGREG